MKLWILPFAASLLATSAAAQVDQQFDLVCKVQDRTAPDLERSLTKTYRLDLDAKRWCEGECVAAHAIVELTPDRIVLERKRPEAPLWAKIDHVISRTAGQVVMMSSGGGSYHTFSGPCEKGGFSGMPKPKF